MLQTLLQFVVSGNECKLNTNTIWKTINNLFFVSQKRHKYKFVYLCVCAGVCTSVDCIAITRIAINNLFASQLMHQIDVIHVLKSFRMTCAPSARPLHFIWYIQRCIHISHGGVTNCPSRVAIVVAACQTGTCHRQTMQLSLSKTKQQNVDHINCTDAVNCGQWNRQAGRHPDRQTDSSRCSCRCGSPNAKCVNYGGQWGVCTIWQCILYAALPLPFASLAELYSVVGNFIGKCMP